MRWTPVALGLMAVLVCSSGLEAQADDTAGSTKEPTIVGIVGGWNINDGIWKPGAESESVGGIILGAFVIARTPAPWFAIRAELTWVQRGVDVTGSIGDDPALGGVRSDYLTVAIHPRASMAVGPLRVHIAAGPTVDQLVRSRIDSSLAPILFRDISTVFGVGLGAGVGGTVADRYRVEVEARVFEGLGDAYSGDFVSVRNRSLEFVTRVGIPRPER